MKKIYLIHIQSESSENYYEAFENKPTDEQILILQREIYIREYREEPEGEYFTDLVPIVFERFVDVN